jgi:hypothetical protein
MSRDNQETIFDLQTGFVPGANQLINDGPRADTYRRDAHARLSGRSDPIWILPANPRDISQSTRTRRRVRRADRDSHALFKPIELSRTLR